MNLEFAIGLIKDHCIHKPIFKCIGSSGQIEFGDQYAQGYCPNQEKESGKYDPSFAALFIDYYIERYEYKQLEIATYRPAPRHAASLRILIPRNEVTY